MKILKYIIIVLVALFGLFLIITAFLPNEKELKTSIKIKAPAKIIFPFINEMKNWEQWSPWYKLDENAKWEYPAAKEGVGAILSWGNSKSYASSGSFEITESEPYKLVKLKLKFYGNDFGDVIFTLDETDGKTEVTWKINAKFGFFGRWAALGFESKIAPYYKRGLDKLEFIAEEAADFKIEISEDEFDGLTVIGKQFRIEMEGSSFAKGFRKGLAEVMDYLKQKDLQMVAPPVVITNEYDGEIWDFYATIPIAKPVATDKGFEIIELSATKVVKCEVTGPYTLTEDAYQASFKYIQKNNLEMTGKVYEMFMNDPEQVKVSEILAHIYFPVK